MSEQRKTKIDDRDIVEPKCGFRLVIWRLSLGERDRGVRPTMGHEYSISQVARVRTLVSTCADFVLLVWVSREEKSKMQQT